MNEWMWKKEWMNVSEWNNVSEWMNKVTAIIRVRATKIISPELNVSVASWLSGIYESPNIGW